MDGASERAREAEGIGATETEMADGGRRDQGGGWSEAERNEKKFRHIITPTRPRIAGPCGWRLNTSSGVRANVRYIGRPAAQGLSA